MKPGLALRPEAEDDVHAAVAWYSAERVALGLEFIEDLDRVFLRIRETPYHFPEVDAEIRRAILGRFPYGVFFQAKPDQIVILGVLHLHRHPDTWKSRD